MTLKGIYIKLSRLKEHIRNKVTFYKIADFYEA